MRHQPVEECRISVNELRQQMEMEYNGMLGVGPGSGHVSGVTSPGGWNETGAGYAFGNNNGGFGNAAFFGQFENPTPPELELDAFGTGTFWGDDIGLFSEAGLVGMGLGAGMGQQMPQPHPNMPPPMMQSYARVPPGGYKHEPVMFE
jgi:hypothetical protein